MKTILFPTILILLMIAAAVAYAATNDWPRATYWLAGAILNVAVTFYM